MTIKNLLVEYSKILESNGFSSPYLDVELLLAKILNVDRVFFIANSEKILSNVEINKFNKLFKRRLKHEPMAYILGHKDFYGLDLYVDKNVLIPRPVTETLVDVVFERIKNIDAKHTYIMDMATGSGAIVLALIDKIYNKNIIKFLGDRYYFYASDKSRNALNVARMNAEKFGCADKITFLEGDFKFPENIKFDYIIANLPYVDRRIVDFNNNDNQKDLRFEPKMALFAGDEGFHLIRKFLQKIIKNELLNENGKVFLEVEDGQILRIRDEFGSFFNIIEHNSRIVELTQR